MHRSPTRLAANHGSLDLEQPVSWAEDYVGTLGADVHE